jgi:hypothetical protein
MELTGADRIHVQLADRDGHDIEGGEDPGGGLAAKRSQAAETVEVPLQAAVRNRFCTHCGKPIDPSWHFCMACGAAIGGKGP